MLREISFSLLSEGRSIRLRADGYSMYPSIKPGSVINVEPYLSGSEPALGDIVAWGGEPGMVVHRIVSIERDNNNMYYVTRGDSTLTEDPPVNPAQIAGKVVRVEYRGKEKKIKNSKPCSLSYSLNRLRIWIILKIKRLLTYSRRDSL